MKVLLYFEAEKVISTSGIGRAQKHQKLALTLAGNLISDILYAVVDPRVRIA